MIRQIEIGASRTSAYSRRVGVRFAAAVSLALIGATLWPLARDPADDGFPLSTYPMFSWKRPTKLRMTYGLGATASGERVYLSPWIAGSGEVLQARAIFDRAASQGRAGLDTLCVQIAARVASLPSYAEVVAIRIVDGTHDAVEYLVRDRIGTETERHRCKVPR